MKTSPQLAANIRALLEFTGRWYGIVHSLLFSILSLIAGAIFGFYLATGTGPFDRVGHAFLLLVGLITGFWALGKFFLQMGAEVTRRREASAERNSRL